MKIENNNLAKHFNKVHWLMKIENKNLVKHFNKVQVLKMSDKWWILVKPGK